ncbi:MAG: 2Fe-2S iron-sulfur cluster-binding protein [Erythrobacter sp.]|nr:2Fe-2S iron-sulfur cluster-binding protein [Erythrobacter sp.]
MLDKVTGVELLGYISAALLAQIAAGIVIAAIRYQRAHDAGFDQEAALPTSLKAAWAGTRAFRVRSRQSEDRAGNQASFYLEPVDGEPLEPYVAGQFLTFQLDLPDDCGSLRGVTRCYSLSDCHNPSAYRITVKRSVAPVDRPDLPPGLVSSYLHDFVTPGTILQVRAPAGVFVLDEDILAPVVLIAGGIGITPLFAMARAALADQPEREIHLFYGVRDHHEQVFGTDLKRMEAQHPNFHLMIVQSEPLPSDGGGESTGPTGFIDVNLLRAVFPAANGHFYVCGPPAMMVSLVPALREWGVAEDALHYEAFGPASIGPAETLVPQLLQTPFVVRFARSGRTIDWTGEDTNLLDFAERHGIDLPSGCRSGSCGTCETTVDAGEVRYAKPPAFDITDGRCLPCIGAPVGDLVLGA